MRHTPLGRVHSGLSPPAAGARGADEEGRGGAGKGGEARSRPRVRATTWWLVCVRSRSGGGERSGYGHRRRRRRRSRCEKMVRLNFFAAGKFVLTCMCRMAAWSMDRLDDFFSSWEGSCFFRISKHSFRWARRFFSSLLCTSLVPDLMTQGGLKLIQDNALFSYFALSFSFCFIKKINPYFPCKCPLSKRVRDHASSLLSAGKMKNELSSSDFEKSDFLQQKQVIYVLWMYVQYRYNS